MKFARIGPPGDEVPVIVGANGGLFDLRPLTRDVDAAFLARNGIDRARTALAEGTLPRLTSGEAVRFGSPIARPQAVVCVGLNYAAHARESGAPIPENPVIFFKHPNTVVGPRDPVTIPQNSQRTDWEVELGVVLAERASYLKDESAAVARIAGFVVVNDLSERQFQLELSGGQWSKGKSAAGFTPAGPYLVTPDEVDPADLRLRSFVNGQPRQDSSTADMIFSVPYLIWHLSQFMVLEPGDLILTGTPEGVALSGRFPYLKPGDVVSVEIEGLGRQRTEFIDA